MSVKDEYLSYRNKKGLKTRVFSDRVKLQRFLRDRLDAIWAEKPTFTNGGLFKNQMTGFALGFAYYDCKPSQFCKTRCYGLPIAGINDYYMLRLAVLASESLKTKDPRFLTPLFKKTKGLDVVKIGHWGDAVLQQVPTIIELVKKNPDTIFWWYTRKIELAMAVNNFNLSNLRSYLSLDPTTPYPSYSEYPYGLTYVIGDQLFHKNHQEILSDDRLVAVFTKKKVRTIEDPSDYGLSNHPKLCIEKKMQPGKKAANICLSCSDRCNFRSSNICS